MSWDFAQIGACLRCPPEALTDPTDGTSGVLYHIGEKTLAIYPEKAYVHITGPCTEYAINHQEAPDLMIDNGIVFHTRGGDLITINANGTVMVETDDLREWEEDELPAVPRRSVPL